MLMAQRYYSISNFPTIKQLLTTFRTFMNECYHIQYRSGADTDIFRLTSITLPPFAIYAYRFDRVRIQEPPLHYNHFARDDLLGLLI
jgi:hypothetical protein